MGDMDTPGQSPEEILAARLLSARQSANLSQARAAALAQVSVKTWRKAEQPDGTGQRLTSIYAMTRVVGIPDADVQRILAGHTPSAAVTATATIAAAGDAISDEDKLRALLEDATPADEYLRALAEEIEALQVNVTPELREALRRARDRFLDRQSVYTDQRRNKEDEPE